MKQTITHLLLVLLFSQTLPLVLSAQKHSLKERNELKKHFDAYGVEGSFLLFDQQKQQWTSYNDTRNKQGFLPASTFKILNSLIALEKGLVQDSSTVLPWNGTKNWNENWNRDLTFKEAFTVSCVPCYRELARRAGLAQMQEYVRQVGYGKMDISSSNLDLFWLTGNSRITPYEQIDFLQRLHGEQLPFRTSSYKQLKTLLLREATAND